MKFEYKTNYTNYTFDNISRLKRFECNKDFYLQQKIYEKDVQILKEKP